MTMNQNNQIPINAFADLICNARLKPELPKCNGNIFTQVFEVKYYRGLMSQGQTVLLQVPLFKCVKCGSIHDVNKPNAQAHGGLTLNEL